MNGIFILSMLFDYATLLLRMALSKKLSNCAFYSLKAAKARI